MAKIDAEDGAQVQGEKLEGHIDEEAASHIGSDVSNEHDREAFHRDTSSKDEPHASLELTRTTTTISTALSRVASRITNRNIVDPGPAPGG